MSDIWPLIWVAFGWVIAPVVFAGVVALLPRSKDVFVTPNNNPFDVTHPAYCRHLGRRIDL